jgi:phosphoserine phosphatase RsbU/P
MPPTATDIAPPATTPDSKHLQCTEVWGGNHFVDSAVEMPGLDLRVYSRPYGSGVDDERRDAGRARAGGDVHYVSTCAAGQISRLVVADVCGHGGHVAEVATLLRTLLRRYVIYHDQRRLVRSINRRFARMTEAGCFATAVVGTFDAANRRLSLSNAGHPPPIHYRAATGEWAYLAQPDLPAGRGFTDLPLGIEDRVRYGEASVQLDVGDLLLLYTDVLPEARTADGGMLGQAGLLALVRRLDPRAPRGAIVNDLLQRVESLSPGNLARDDVTLLLVRANGERPWASLPVMVMAPARAIRSVIGSYLPG